MAADCHAWSGDPAGLVMNVVPGLCAASQVRCSGWAPTPASTPQRSERTPENAIMNPHLPTRTRARVLVVAVGVLSTLAACRDDSVSGPVKTPVTPAGPRLSLTQVAADPTPSQLAVAQAVPGFGGYFIDAADRPTVYLTDPSRSGDAAKALSGFLQSFGWTAADLQVRQATYDYLQLDAWYRAARPSALGITGAVFGDIDEARNRITFAGVNANALANMAGAVAGAGVPSQAVTLQVHGPVFTASTLRDQFRPPYGGLQVQFFPVPASPVVLVCTIGFNAIDGADTSFITNSHCSNVQGGTLTPTDYYQAVRGGVVADANNYIAREVEDPDYAMGSLAGPCPIGRRCRTADVSRAKYQPGQAFTLGKIARPLNENPTGTTLTDTITINPTTPTFTIVAEQGRSVLGQKLNHVGRTSGWTSGLVTATCVDVDVTDSDITQLCQDFVDTYVAGGDSGSPVFGLNTDGTVFLGGILWGGSTDLETNHVQFIMSPLDAIKAEIGNIKTFDPPAVVTKHVKKPR
jgi:hypothetical protein